jgi:hypothetical protein
MRAVSAISSTEVTAQMLGGPEALQPPISQEQHPAAVHEDGLVARRYRHLPRVSDSVIDLDEGHQASHVDHVPIMPLESMAPGVSAERSGCGETDLNSRP